MNITAASTEFGVAGVGSESVAGSENSCQPALAEVVRSGFVEARHRGSLVILGSDGSVELAVGDITRPIFPRSSNKPMQATAMLRSGLDLDGELLALITASHSGEDFHVDGVRRVLAGAGLDESHLLCPPSWPIDEGARIARIRAGEPQARVTMNCSGKHSGMLAACVTAGWPTATYTDPDHPLQRAVGSTIEELAGEKVVHVGVDGCGAPLMAFSLTGLARAFRTMMLAREGSPERRIVDAVRAYPTWTSGTTRDEAALISSVPGIFGKSGAEGCYALALPDGRAVALKLECGAERVRWVVMAGVLEQLGVDAPIVREQRTSPVYGGGRVVGEIRPVPLG